MHSTAAPSLGFAVAASPWPGSAVAEAAAVAAAAASASPFAAAVEAIVAAVGSD